MAMCISSFALIVDSLPLRVSLFLLEVVPHI